MTRVWIGYSENLGFRDLICEYIDPYFGPVEEDYFWPVEEDHCGPVEEEDRPIGRLELEFGASNIGPGDFEVYEKTPENQGSFSFDYIMALLPFESEIAGLRTICWSKAKTVFFIMNDRDPSKTFDENVSVTDVLDVKFEWE